MHKRVRLAATIATAILASMFAAVPTQAHAGTLETYFERLKTLPLAPEIDSRGTFRDLAFGTACSTAPGMTMTKDLTQFRAFSRAADKLSIGTGNLTSIRYLCFSDALRVVFIALPKDSIPSVALAMVGTYGTPSSSEKDVAFWRGLKRVAWLGCASTAECFLTIGDMPWADPLGLLAMLAAANVQAGQTDL